MEKRQLGSTNIYVAPLTLGGNVFGWTIDEKKSFEILDAFVDRGFNFIDTADVYSRWASGIGGESETIIGKWMKSRNNREKVVIATKVGFEMGKGKEGLSKNYIRSAVEDSLKRLQTDYIDLYQSHMDDEKRSLQETLEAYDSLISEGKVRAIGASNYSAARLKESLEISSKNNLPRYQTLQPLYNLCDREVYEKELEPVCLENNISVINYYSLAAGFLTGKYRSENDLGKSVRGQKASRYMNERGMRILKALDEVVKESHSSHAAVAIAWLLSKPSVTAPIASATTLSQLHQITDSVNLSLSNEMMARLTTASNY
jgi:aryl-alcohol dehydrogenase-like predicted oxidoreductase